MDQQICSENEILVDIIEKYSKIVSSLCNRIVYDRELAKDAAQEVWLEVFKSISKFRGKSKLSTWVYAPEMLGLGYTEAPIEYDHSLKG
ncbi:RNA polymerase sigma factor [Clostridium oryzae]|uniref:RNA polymerase sigma factor n=1 Tax=Clostridium oryzae TaxID=1450648 RepID=UPI001473DC19|nr:sigma-70 family RNA polymerase sigma factor [Clostridium oryzae]